MSYLKSSKALWNVMGLIFFWSLTSLVWANSPATASSNQSKKSYEITDLLYFAIEEENPGELGIFSFDQGLILEFMNRMTSILAESGKNFSRKNKAAQYKAMKRVLGLFNFESTGKVKILNHARQVNQQVQRALSNHDGYLNYDHPTDRIIINDIPYDDEEYDQMEKGKDYIALRYSVPASVVGPTMHQQLLDSSSGTTMSDNVDLAQTRKYLTSFIEKQAAEIERVTEVIKEFDYIVRAILATEKSIPYTDEAKLMTGIDDALQAKNFYDQFKYFSKRTSSYPQGKYEAHDVLTLLKTFNKAFETRTFKAADKATRNPCPQNLL